MSRTESAAVNNPQPPKKVFYVDLDATLWSLVFKDVAAIPEPFGHSIHDTINLDRFTGELFDVEIDRDQRDEIVQAFKSSGVLLFLNAYRPILQYIAEHHHLVLATAGMWSRAFTNYVFQHAYSIGEDKFGFINASTAGNPSYQSYVRNYLRQQGKAIPESMLPDFYREKAFQIRWFQRVHLHLGHLEHAHLVDDEPQNHEFFRDHVNPNGSIQSLPWGIINELMREGHIDWGISNDDLLRVESVREWFEPEIYQHVLELAEQSGLMSYALDNSDNDDVPSYVKDFLEWYRHDLANHMASHYFRDEDTGEASTDDDDVPQDETETQASSSLDEHDNNDAAGDEPPHSAGDKRPLSSAGAGLFQVVATAPAKRNRSAATNVAITAK